MEDIETRANTTVKIINENLEKAKKDIKELFDEQQKLESVQKSKAISPAFLEVPGPPKIKTREPPEKPPPTIIPGRVTPQVEFGELEETEEFVPFMSELEERQKALPVVKEKVEEATPTKGFGPGFAKVKEKTIEDVTSLIMQVPEEAYSSTETMIKALKEEAKKYEVKLKSLHKEIIGNINYELLKDLLKEFKAVKKTSLKETPSETEVPTETEVPEKMSYFELLTKTVHKSFHESFYKQLEEEREAVLEKYKIGGISKSIVTKGEEFTKLTEKEEILEKGEPTAEKISKELSKLKETLKKVEIEPEDVRTVKEIVEKNFDQIKKIYDTVKKEEEYTNYFSKEIFEKLKKSERDKKHLLNSIKDGR